MNYDGFESFGQMFKQAWAQAKSDDGFANKTYEQILEEYEKFFSLDPNAHSERSNVNQSTKGAHCSRDLNLTFAEVVSGVKKILMYFHTVRCESCHGRKVKATKDQESCPKCYGNGESTRTTGDLCPYCFGTGLKSVRCTTCRGDGIIQ